MNGPAHYREAEAVIAQVKNRDLPSAALTVSAAVAQVHATLALTAAVIAGNAHKMEPAERHEWQRAADPGYDAGQAPGAAL